MTQKRRKALKANDMKVWKDIALKQFSYPEQLKAVETVIQRINELLQIEKSIWDFSMNEHCK